MKKAEKTGAPARRSWKKEFQWNWDLYLFILIPFAFMFVFNYLPMYGAQVAFKRFVVSRGILGSPWVGLDNFKKFFAFYRSLDIIWNTISINIYGLLVGFPIPIIFAVMLNYCYIGPYKRITQMVTYAPHFISVVVMCGMILRFLAPRAGLFNMIREGLGLEALNFMGRPEFFSSIYVWSGIWQGFGWGSIIYIAALSGVNPEMHESATIDGANIFQRILHIDLPTILPVISIQLILSAGALLNIGHEKVLLLQNSLNISRSEVIQTFVFKTGIAPGAGGVADVSYSSAVGLLLSLTNFVILIIVNFIVRKTSKNSLF
jgi:putative aldouronate transport system permease protein